MNIDFDNFIDTLTKTVMRLLGAPNAAQHHLDFAKGYVEGYLAGKGQENQLPAILTRIDLVEKRYLDARAGW